MSHHHILIIEDNDNLAGLLEKELARKLYKISRAANGEEGIVKAKTLKPDLLLLDIMMPFSDGTEVIKEVRTQGEWGKKVPIIVLSNVMITDKRVDAVLTHSPAFYLIKSDANLELIISKIEQCLLPAALMQ